MLYDPKWEQKTKADPFELGTLIAWLETKAPSGEYEFMNCDGLCLMGQYMTACGVVWSDANYLRFAKHFTRIAVGNPRTFGGALKRARAFARS